MRQAGVAQVVKHDRSLQRVMLDVQRLADDADGAQVFAEQLGAVLGRRHVEQAFALPLGPFDERVHIPTGADVFCGYPPPRGMEAYK